MSVIKKRVSDFLYKYGAAVIVAILYGIAIYNIVVSEPTSGPAGVVECDKQGCSPG